MEGGGGGEIGILGPEGFCLCQRGQYLIKSVQRDLTAP